MLKKFKVGSKKIAVRMCLFFAALFYDKNYLKGRHFTNCFTGIKWVIEGVWRQKILGFNRHVPWPCAFNCFVSNPDNIIFHIDDLNNFRSPGTYYQNFAEKIILKRGCYIGPNVGIITANHDINDLDLHCQGKTVIICENCWIGMNSVLLPGVTLGPRTIVGAGSVVTKSFPEGGVVIAGNPARIVKKL